MNYERKISFSFQYLFAERRIGEQPSQMVPSFTFRLRGSSTSSSEKQPRKGSRPMDSVEGGRTMLVSEVQSWKAWSSTFSVVMGSTRFFSDEQLANMNFPIMSL